MFIILSCFNIILFQNIYLDMFVFSTNVFNKCTIVVQIIGSAGNQFGAEQTLCNNFVHCNKPMQNIFT